jgi:hypothetical protein
VFIKGYGRKRTAISRKKASLLSGTLQNTHIQPPSGTHNTDHTGEHII